MASDEDASPCRLCGEAIHDERQRIYINGNQDQQQRFLYHSSCFKCLVCKRPLSPENHFLSCRFEFLCWQHYNFSSPNTHINFVHEMRSFKERSRDKTNFAKAAMAIVQPNQEAFPDKIVSQSIHVSCDCVSGELVLQNLGYWIECTVESCPFFNSYCQCKYSKSFDVDEWDEELRRDMFVIQHHEEEIFEFCFLNQRHFNYYSVDELIGPVVLSLKQEVLRHREFFRVLVRSSSHIIEGLLPISCFCASKYNEQDIVDILCKELRLTSALRPFVDSLPPEKLKSLDKVMLKEDFKVGVVFIKDGQVTEEDFFTNVDHSSEFEDFLKFLGNRIQLRGFEGYNGGLDTMYGLTGETTVYREWKQYKFMFHVSTLLPMEEHDDQKLQRKRHIGNDIVCLVFLASSAKFQPSSIKSNFLHLFIVLQPFVVNDVQHYKLSVVSRDQVAPFGPPLIPNRVFKKDDQFLNWLLSKIVNGERASYRSQKFATMQERTRRQLLEEIVHDQACKEVQCPSRTGRGAMHKIFPSRHPASPRLPVLQGAKKLNTLFPDWVQEKIDDTEQLQRDLKMAFINGGNQYYDVTFIVGSYNPKPLHAVKALLSARSKVFHGLLLVPHDLVKDSTSIDASPPTFRRPSLQRSASSPQSIVRARKMLADMWKKNRSTSQGNFLAPGKQDPVAEGEIVKPSSPPTEYIVSAFEPDEFSTLLDFVHTGSCVIYAENLAGVLCAADFYDMKDLVLLCFQCFDDLVNPVNACLILTALQRFLKSYDVAEEMQNRVLAFIESHAAEVFNQFDVASLSEDVFMMMLNHPLQIKEVQKFRAARSWYQRTSVLRRKACDDGLKESLFALIDFTQISLDELTETALDSEFLPAGLLGRVVKR